MQGRFVPRDAGATERRPAARQSSRRQWLSSGCACTTPLALGMHVSIMEKGEDRSAEVSILHNGKGRGGPERGRGCPPSQPAAPSAPERHTPQVVAAHSTLHVPARAVFRHGETLGMVAVARNAHGEAVRAPKISVSAPCVSN